MTLRSIRDFLIALAVCTITGAVAQAGTSERAQYDELKAQAAAALRHGQTDLAKARLRDALALTTRAGAPANEVYRAIVSPLARLYSAAEQLDELHDLYRSRAEESGLQGLALGLAQSDYGFLLQRSDVSRDRFLGEQMVESAVQTFAGCRTHKNESQDCRSRLADTMGIQAAFYFEQQDYKRAEPLFRKVIGFPENEVQREVMIVALHALKGIRILNKDYEEARSLEIKAAEFESRHPGSAKRLQDMGSRSRTK